jgi:D-alanyl-D-alanine carboxypeptidase/D-alanyl-D-alanine-endopeptidase (penicillin-binding protein 4)
LWFFRTPIAAAGNSAVQQKALSIIKAAQYDTSRVGVYIKEIGADAPTVSIQADTRFIPASVQKLVTAAAATELLGPDYLFKTSVYHDGVFDRDSGAILGNLYIRGGGDPGFLAERIWLFVQHLKHQGIRRIRDDLILDDFFFDTVMSGPGYSEDLSSRAYEAPISALSASFNTVAVHVAPGSAVGSPIKIHPFPRIKGVPVISTAKTLGSNASAGIEVKTQILDGKTSILVFGGMRLGDKPRYVYRKVWETWQNFGWVMQAYFEEAGIDFSGELRHQPTPDSLLGRPLYVFKSKPIAEFVTHMFKYSSNFAAEMVFKTMSAEKDTVAGSWPASARLASGWWKNNNLPGEPSIANGSGMGNRNRISPHQVAALLEHVWNEKSYLPEYLSALSIAGQDGTLKSRFRSSPLRGIVRAKTGTLNMYGVSSLAGYVLFPGKTYAFAILINASSPGQYSHWQLQRKILEAAIR